MPKAPDHSGASDGTGLEPKLQPGPIPRAVARVLRAQDREWFGYILAVPALALIGLVVLYPVAQGIDLAFTNAGTLTPGQQTYVGFQNFQTLFADPAFYNGFPGASALVNSVTLTVIAVALELVLGTGLALLLRNKVPGIQFFRSVTMASWVIPVVATVMMFNLMWLPKFGLVNIVLGDIGLGRANTYWFGNLSLAMPAIIIMHVWRNTPFFAIALFASMQGIPSDQYEAAAIDGASWFSRFRHITVPGIAYVAMIMIIIHVLWTFNNFDFVYLSTGGGPINATMVMPVYVYLQFWHNYTAGYAASAGVVMLVMLLIVTIPYILTVRETDT
ncbi:MAG: carbohydrate ABC transporter permease [Chloroflexota bacterium]